MRIKNSWLLMLLIALFAVGCASTPGPADPAPPAPPNSLKIGETNIVAISAPPAPAPAGPQMTLPEFLGLRNLGVAAGGAFQRVCSRLKVGLGLVGRFPNLQPKPPIVPITDPANLDENASPAVQTAAKVKAEQDQAPQKIQALRYLATIGCGGCYPDVEDALLAALDDCTEEVRFEAVKALRGGPGKACQYCRSTSCCSAKVQEKLRKLISETDGCGCHVESSDRVRRQARLALQECGPPVLAPEDSAIPEEGPAGDSAGEPTLAGARSDRTSVSSIRQVSFEGGPTEGAEMILGYVGHLPVLSSEVEKQRLLIDTSGAFPATESERDQQTRQALELVIDRHVLKLQYLTERHLDQWDDSRYEDYDLWLEEKLSVADEVLPTTIQRYYESHLEDYRTPAEVRWEKAAIAFRDSREEGMARQILEYLQGVARGESPREPAGLREMAVDTRAMPWTSPSDLTNAELRNVLFSTATGRTGPILKIGNQLVLVRILQRTEPQLISLAQATPSIREQLALERRQKRLEQIVDQYREQATIWTVFDGPPPTAAAAQETPQVSPSAEESSLSPPTPPAEISTSSAPLHSNANVVTPPVAVPPPAVAGEAAEGPAAMSQPRPPLPSGDRAAAPLIPQAPVETPSPAETAPPSSPIAPALALPSGQSAVPSLPEPTPPAQPVVDEPATADESIDRVDSLPEREPASAAIQVPSKPIVDTKSNSESDSDSNSSYESESVSDSETFSELESESDFQPAAPQALAVPALPVESLLQTAPAAERYARSEESEPAAHAPLQKPDSISFVPPAAAENPSLSANRKTPLENAAPFSFPAMETTATQERAGAPLDSMAPSAKPKFRDLGHPSDSAAMPSRPTDSSQRVLLPHLPRRSPPPPSEGGRSFVDKLSEVMGLPPGSVSTPASPVRREQNGLPAQIPSSETPARAPSGSLEKSAPEKKKLAVENPIVTPPAPKPSDFQVKFSELPAWQEPPAIKMAPSPASPPSFGTPNVLTPIRKQVTETGQGWSIQPASATLPAASGAEGSQTNRTADWVPPPPTK